MPDDVTATLEEWGERFEQELSRAVGAESADSLRRSLSLVAAVEAVLEAADDLEVPSLRNPPTKNQIAATFREAITRALTASRPPR